MFGTRKQKYREIRLPHNWTPRHYQLELFQALDSGQRKAAVVWHRRAGKDMAMTNYAAKAAMDRVGTYWHSLPTQKQARKVIWDAIDSDGRRVIDQAFPKEIVKRRREDDMMVEFVNGAIWRLVGGDNIDSLVGSNVVGITWSEASLTSPSAIRYARPILAESKGWEVQIGTPRGMSNHFYKTCEMAKTNPEWFYTFKTIDHTKALTMAQIQSERDSGMPEELIQQEYFCDFTASMVGAIYGREIVNLETEGRITSVPYDPRLPVFTGWDLGVADPTIIWFCQRVGHDIHVIDCEMVPAREGLPKAAQIIHGKPYAYIQHAFPHDGNVTEFGTGLKRSEMAEQLGLKVDVCPRADLEDQLQRVRLILPRCKFDATKCADGIEALKNYRKEWDEEKGILKPKPVHDWTSHYADAFRSFCVAPEPEALHIPNWAADLTRGHGLQTGWRPPGLGHNGGPPLSPTDAPYDPLENFRRH